MINIKKIYANYFIKLKQLVLITIGCFIIILGRLLYLQVYKASNFYKLSTNNFTRTRTVQSPRGNICDIKGNLLATNRPVKNIIWQGSGNRNISKQQLRNLEKIAQITNQEIPSSLLKKIQIAEKHRKNIILFKDINFAALSKIEEQFPSNYNIEITNDFKRFYPHKKLGCHIVGYLGTMNINKIGKMGIERIFEEQLKGKEGANKSTINSLGKRITDTEIESAIAGHTITTTLDLDIQKIGEKSFNKQYSGSLIIMDPEDGSIKALLSKPDFNPTIFLEPISDKTWNGLLETKPFINRSLNACYPPASIFKLVTVAAGLELGLITTESTFKCRGHVVFGHRRYHCNRRRGHGVLTIKQALAHSCNVLFYKLGQSMSIDLLADYAKKFGLGRRTGIIFPEQEGLVPNTAWKINTKGERWWVGETLSASIGQSYLLTTPIQIAKMVSGIFKGYLVQPRILNIEPITKEVLDVKQETLDFLQESMKKAVTSGTGKRVSKIQDLTVYAKTGTAQTCSLQKRYLGGTHLEHAWFVGSFHYKDQDPLTIVILVEHAGATRIAINIAKKFLVQYRQLIEKQNS
jgi:penicillin-binding protein 2